MLRFSSLFSFALVCAAQTAAVAPDGKALFEKNCALCHKTTTENRVPTFDALRLITNRAIVVALESGSMKTQAAALSGPERQAIADFLAAKTAASVEATAMNSCDAKAPALSNLNGWNGWSTDLVNSRMQSEGGIRAEDVPKLKVKW